MMLRTVSEKVVEIRGVKRAILGMHYASDEFAGNDIQAFAEQTQRYAPYVEGMGLYSSISGTLRKEFETYTAASLQMPFFIHSYGPDGTPVRHDNREEYYPITSVHSDSYRERGFLGTDLAVEDGIAAVLKEAISTGQGALVARPKHWPINGAAVMLQPVYLAEGPPATAEDRRELHGGGIWMELNMRALFSGKFDHATGLLELRVGSGLPNEALLYSRDGGAAVARSLFDYGA